MSHASILLIEDNPGDARLIEQYLHHTGGADDYSVEVAQTVTEGVARIKAQGYDAVLTDLSLPDSDGLLSVYKLLDAAPDVPLVVLTGNDDKEMAVMAVREGAQEYLVKGDINAAVLGRVLKYSIERHNQVSQLRHMAYHDTLTGLPNRMMFLHTLEHDMALARRNQHALAVHFLDLDNFKEINDKHGHDFGDVFLKAVGERLTNTLRAVDSVARFGGDEFVILQNMVATTDNVMTFAEKVRKAFATPLDCEGKQVMTGVSAGISIFPEQAQSAEELITKADKALYRAKAAGKGCYRCYADN
jgi:diguanylate cyclase (GGDEF)-like protein